ncbi:MAG: response regulator, partial [Tissierellia bacterium]|nr:response regulator [Tissierellia bacterium]
MNQIQKLIPRERKYIISILISLLIISISILSLIKINFIKEESNYIANKGIIDLKNWNMDEEEIIKLDGEWEFYSGEFYTSKDELNKEIKQYVKVPGSWESYLDGKGLENISGTYRLNIKLPEDMIYGLKAKTIRLANRIYINGVEVANVGNPSLMEKSFKPGSQYNIGIGNSIEGNIELIIHVTSQPNRSGGIIKSIEFGTVDAITSATDESTILDAFVVSVCLVLGLYFFLIYLQRHKESYLAYYSGASLFMGLSLSTVNEQILKLVYDYDFIARTRIQILAMVMVTFCFIRFIHSYFKDYSNKKTGNMISALMMANLIFVSTNPERTGILSTNNALLIIMISMTISFIYIFYVLIKTMYKNIDLTEYILVITTSLFSYWVILALKTIFELDLGNIPVILILFTMLGVAALVSQRLQLDYQQARDISEKMIRYDGLKDDFLIKSSRELKLPLQNILYSLKQLLEGDKGPLSEEQQEDLLLILYEGKGLIRLAEDLQDASLIKKDGSNMNFSAIEPFKIVDDIVAEVEMIIPLNGQVILQNEIPKDFPLIYADSDKFRQILYDLIHNAIKYTKAGKIAISAAIMEEQAQITVSDTGMGIEEKYSKEVFDKFFQKGEEGQVNKGLGLGLSIVKHLVEIQGGKIKVQSIHGKGSDFIFTLPLYDKNIDEEKEMNDNINRYDEISSFVRENKGIELDNTNILIVDDDLANQKILSGIIRELNYNVVIANTGNEAITILKDNRIDLIIIDFMLPDMAASHLCSEIRKKHSMVELPILILTQSGRTVDRINTFYFGANDFQKKPINSEELKSRIESLLLMKTSAERALEKEFQYFYSQISPHFLYNTLNSIIGISYIDGDKAREGLNNLAVYFRGKLDIHRKKGLVSIDSELELVSAYLGIEQIRYGDKLQVEYDIEDNLSAMIPPLSLQTIIENSVNHGLAVKENGGKIKISAKRYNNDF